MDRSLVWRSHERWKLDEHSPVCTKLSVNIRTDHAVPSFNRQQSAAYQAAQETLTSGPSLPQVECVYRSDPDRKRRRRSLRPIRRRVATLSAHFCEIDFPVDATLFTMRLRC